MSLVFVPLIHDSTYKRSVEGTYSSRFPDFCHVLIRMTRVTRVDTPCLPTPGPFVCVIRRHPPTLPHFSPSDVFSPSTSQMSPLTEPLLMYSGPGSFTVVLFVRYPTLVNRPVHMSSFHPFPCPFSVGFSIEFDFRHNGPVPCYPVLGSDSTEGDERRTL